MSARIIPGRSWTNKIRLPEELTNLDTDSPIGAAAAGATIRILNSCRSMDDIGNVAAIAGAFNVVDASQQAKVSVAKKEYTYLVDGSGKEVKTSDVNKVNILVNAGYKVDRIEEVDVTG